MKSKIVQFILIGFIVLMVSGIFMSVKEGPSNEVSEVISNFENQSEFGVNGYVSTDLFNEDNTNALGEFNGKVGNAVSKGVNKGIDFIFELIKKLIS